MTREPVFEGPPGAARPFVPFVQALQKDDMRRLGTRTTQRLARATLGRRGRREVAFRRSIYMERFEELLAGNGGVPAEPIVLNDGFAIDRSRALPHLEEAMAAGAALIEEYGGRRWEHEKPYLQNINPEEAIERYPALIDFIASSEMLAAVAPTFGYIPPLATLLPRGVRLMESSTRFDPQADGPFRESQLYHLDYHHSPTLYVVLVLRDIGPEDGALHFLGAAASARVAEEVGYGKRGVPYRLEDDTVNAIVDPDEVHVFAEPAGTVLWIDSSACFHFGSRRPANDRYQLQYGFVSPVRNDFLSVYRRQRVYETSPEDPALRRLVLDRGLLDLTN